MRRPRYSAEKVAEREWRIERARHEAGHIVSGRYCLPKRYGRIDVVTIDPRADREPGVAGFVHIAAGPPRDPAEPPVMDAAKRAGITREVKEIALRKLAAVAYSGVAAQQPTVCGRTEVGVRCGRADFEGLSADLLRIGVTLSPSEWRQDLYDLGAAVVDQFWGQVLALSEALFDVGTIDRAEIERLIENAPQVVNQRRKWGT